MEQRRGSRTFQMFLSLLAHRIHTHRSTLLPGWEIWNNHKNQRRDRQANRVNSILGIPTNQNTRNLPGCYTLSKNPIRNPSKKGTNFNSDACSQQLFSTRSVAFLLHNVSQRNRIPISCQPADHNTTSCTPRSDGVSHTQQDAL